MVTPVLVYVIVGFYNLKVADQWGGGLGEQVWWHVCLTEGLRRRKL